MHSIPPTTRRTQRKNWNRCAERKCVTYWRKIGVIAAWTWRAASSQASNRKWIHKMCILSLSFIRRRSYTLASRTSNNKIITKTKYGAGELISINIQFIELGRIYANERNAMLSPNHLMKVSHIPVCAFPIGRQRASIARADERWTAQECWKTHSSSIIFYFY